MAQVDRITIRFVWAFAFCAVAACAQDSCKPVHDIHDFVQIWNDAVIGPGSRSHICTLHLLTPDAKITGVIMGKDGKSSRTVESPQEFVGNNILDGMSRLRYS
jgi:hypothetical protein